MENTPEPTVQGGKNDRLKSAGAIIFAVSTFLCAHEMVPGWGLFHLHWPTNYFYVIAAVGGAIGGALYGGKYLLPGLVGGAIAGPGALFALGKYLGFVTTSYTLIDVLVGAAGAAPGVLIGWLMAMAQKHLGPQG